MVNAVCALSHGNWPTWQNSDDKFTVQVTRKAVLIKSLVLHTSEYFEVQLSVNVNIKVKVKVNEVCRVNHATGPPGTHTHTRSLCPSRVSVL